MTTIRYTFDEIKESKKVSGVCKKCSKRRTRTVSNSQTVNPYNRNKDGQPKLRHEIREEVSLATAKDAEELKSTFICASCFE